MKQRCNMSEENEQDNEQEVIDSGVEGVSADDLYQNAPVFDVDNDSFFKNMKVDRNRMRFPNGSKPSQFMMGTKHRQPFYIRHTDRQGQKYMKKIK